MTREVSRQFKVPPATSLLALALGAAALARSPLVRWRLAVLWSVA